MRGRGRRGWPWQGLGISMLDKPQKKKDRIEHLSLRHIRACEMEIELMRSV